MPISDLISGLADNPYFGAGFGLFGIGAGAAILRRALQGATILFRRHYMMTLEVKIYESKYPERKSRGQSGREDSRLLKF